MGWFQLEGAASRTSKPLEAVFGVVQTIAVGGSNKERPSSGLLLSNPPPQMLPPPSRRLRRAPSTKEFGEERFGTSVMQGYLMRFRDDPVGARRRKTCAVVLLL